MTDADFSTESATTLSEIIDPRLQHLANTKEQVWLISSPIVITVGTLGNLLTIWIFLRSAKLRSTSTSLYLVVLAVVDTLLLYVGLLRQYCRVKYDLDFRSLNIFLCKIGLFGVYFLVHFEAWILVNVTLERFAAVFIPHKVKQLFSKQRAALAIALTGCILFIFNIHYWWEAELKIDDDGKYCTTEHSFYETHWPRIDLALASALPFIVIFTMNCVIIIKIALRSKGLTSSKSSSKTSSMTAILVSVSITFLVFTLPITIHMLQYRDEFYDNATQLEIAQNGVSWAVVNVIYYLNNSTNFFLYCVSGTRFRREFLALICKNRVQPTSNVTATQAMEA